MEPQPIRLSQLGLDFVTRRQGDLARQLLEIALRDIPEERRVDVSLAGVGAMSPSFADECFGKLLLSLGPDRFRTRIALVDADEITKTLLNAVLSRRAREASGEPV